MNNNNRHHNRHKYALRLAFACESSSEHLMLLHSHHCRVEFSVLLLCKTCEMEENVVLKLFDFYLLFHTVRQRYSRDREEKDSHVSSRVYACVLYGTKMKFNRQL